jgi:hypothetical protein
MLSAVMLNAVMLSVVAPLEHPLRNFLFAFDELKIRPLWFSVIFNLATVPDFANEFFNQKHQFSIKALRYKTSH